LNGVSRANSAGVALLVAWLGRLQRRQQAVTFVNVPAQMRAIIEVADLDTVLPLA
jgi:phospholipid transport system transporter-binding protein